jgi:YjbR
VSTAADFRRIALSLEGTTQAPHFDRTAFRVTRIYATLAPDKRTANIRFMPDEQELKCLVAPDAFAPIPNAWGRQGWTVATLSKLSVAELRAALEMAWQHTLSKKKATKRRKPRL